jgi:hypothetical protein
MKRLFIFLFLATACLVYAQSVSHIVTGVLQNNDGSYVDGDCIEFRAFLAENPANYLTQDSTGCAMNDSLWIINAGNLPGLSIGDTLVIVFTDTCNGEILEVRGMVNMGVPGEEWGLLTLTPGVFAGVTVFYPNGGETFFWGDTVEVRWLSHGPITRVRLDYSPNNGADWFPIVLDTPNDGAFTWGIPSINSNLMRMRVTALDTAVSDISDRIFTINERPRVTLTYPEGGERFTAGDIVNIRWNSSATITLVDLFFSSNGGTTWSEVATSRPATGNFDWNVPHVQANQGLIKVQQRGVPAVFDQNDPFFRVDTLLDPGDTIPPAAVTDLHHTAVDTFSADIEWTATGDDNLTGTATLYDIRYSTADINLANWDAATAVAGVPAPLVSGTVQNMRIGGLLPNTLYYVAMKVLDEVPNISGLSNVDTFRTLYAPPPPDTISPSGLTLEEGDFGCNFVTVAFNATGDDGMTGTADHYEFRYSTAPINAENFASATLVSSGVPLPLAPGTRQTVRINGLSGLTDYYVAALVYDDEGNVSVLSNVVMFTTTECADATPPGTIWDLTCTSVGTRSIRFNFLAPGDRL